MFVPTVINIIEQNELAGTTINQPIIGEAASSV
jgi:hypothetical protein